jgi:hypothetical protein
MKIHARELLFLGALGLLFAAPGCSSTPNLNYLTRGPVAGSAQPKRPATVAVVAEPALAAYKHEFKFGGGGRVYELGEPLKQHAINSAKVVFKDAREFPSAAAAAGQADAILVPSVSAVDMSACVGASGMRHMLISIEWLVMDRNNQTPLWLETASGRASHKAAMMGSRERKLIRDAFDALGSETVTLLRKVPSIENVAGK